MVMGDRISSPRITHTKVTMEPHFVLKSGMLLVWTKLVAQEAEATDAIRIAVRMLSTLRVRRGR